MRIRNEAKKKVLEEDIVNNKQKYGSLDSKLIKKSEYKAQSTNEAPIEKKARVPTLNLNQKKGDSVEINGKKPLKALLFGGCFGVQESNRSDHQALLGEGSKGKNKLILK